MDRASEGFSHGERLLLRTIRLLALQADCQGQGRCFEAACGCGGEEAYRALAAFVEQLRLNGQRRIVISVPPARTLTGDERTLLAAFAAAQNDDYSERTRGWPTSRPPSRRPRWAGRSAWWPRCSRCRG